MIIKEKQAAKIDSHFNTMIDRIRRSATENKIIILNTSKARSFVKALKLAGVIDRFTLTSMKMEIDEAEKEAYKKLNERQKNNCLTEE